MKQFGTAKKESMPFGAAPDRITLSFFIPEMVHGKSKP
jgi:hypothetical protein